MSQIYVAWSEKNQEDRGPSARAAHGKAGGPERTKIGRTRTMHGAAAAAAAFAALALAPGAHEAQAALIASWNLNTLDPLGSTVLPASAGLGTLDMTGLGTGMSTMLGTTIGAQPGETAGNALAVVGTLYNQSSFRIEVDAGGFTDLALSFAARRSTTGFATNRIDYWAGLGWTTLASFSASTTAWELQSYSFASLTNMPGGYLTLRVVLDGATGSTGSIRFDNFAVTGTPVPAPAGALALVGIAACVSRRRR